MKTQFLRTIALLALIFSSTAQASFFSDLAASMKNRRELQKRESALKDANHDAWSTAMTQARVAAIMTLESTVTPNNVPAAKCVYKSPLKIPNSDLGISQFEIWTVRRGTEDRVPDIVGFLKFRDLSTFKDGGGTTLPMTILEQGWVTDRHMQPKGITEVTYRKDVEIDGTTYNVVFKRHISDIQKPEVTGEFVLYSIGEKPEAVLHARCKTEAPKPKKQ